MSEREKISFSARATDTGFYHEGSRRLQDQFDTRRVADRLDEVQVHTRFTPEDRALVERARMFFLATANDQGEPECSYKGGLPGFVRVVDDRTLAPHQWRSDLARYRSTAGGIRGRSTHRSREGYPYFSQLPALYSRDAACQTFRVRSARASHTTGAGLETVGGIS
jgi:hypothetical protein